jgi:signal transduction histidine kinase
VEAGPFELILNSPADVQVLELPSWWTAEHTAMVVVGMALVILFGVFWITILHQQVNRRTVQLSAANQSLQEEMSERQRAEEELIRTRSQHLIEQERTRIAKDLHDDLGASMTRMTLMLELAAHPADEAAAGHVQAGLGAAREAIKSLDAAVWAVNPRNNTLPELIDYIGQFGMEFLQHAHIQCELDLPDDPPTRPVSAELRHNLFLIAKEALNNAVRHARASRVCLRIVVAGEMLALRIEDNGCGFEKPPDNSMADGLRNMRQRADGIGGVCRIESQPGRGTQVVVEYHWPKSD